MITWVTKNNKTTWSVSTNEKPCGASDRRKNIEHESLFRCHRVSQLIVKHAEVCGKFSRPEHYNFHQPPGSMVISQPSVFLADPVLNAQITLRTDFHYLPRSLVHTNQCWLPPSVSTYFNSLATLCSRPVSIPSLIQILAHFLCSKDYSNYTFIDSQSSKVKWQLNFSLC